MKFGYFDDANKEYVITSPRTPYPWINYLGTQDFFSLISNTAGGYSFYKDSASACAPATADHASSAALKPITALSPNLTVLFTQTPSPQFNRHRTRAVIRLSTRHGKEPGSTWESAWLSVLVAVRNLPAPDRMRADFGPLY